MKYINGNDRVGEAKVYDTRDAELEKLKEENKIMREALEFYARHSSWLSSLEPSGFGDYENIDILDLEETDKHKKRKCGGKRAREALKKVGE